MLAQLTGPKLLAFLSGTSSPPRTHQGWAPGRPYRWACLKTKTPTRSFAAIPTVKTCLTIFKHHHVRISPWLRSNTCEIWASRPRTLRTMAQNMTRSWPFIVGMTLPTAWRLELEWLAQQRFVKHEMLGCLSSKMILQPTCFRRIPFLSVRRLRSPSGRWDDVLRCTASTTPVLSRVMVRQCYAQTGMNKACNGGVTFIHPPTHIIFRLCVALFRSNNQASDLKVYFLSLWIEYVSSPPSTCDLPCWPLFLDWRSLCKMYNGGVFLEGAPICKNCHLNLWNGGLFMVVHDSS